MAVSLNQKQTFRLRELSDEALGRGRGELRTPSRRTRKFDESLQNPRAGEVVGQFPANFDKAPERPKLKRRPLEVATLRQQPRSAVAALMAREGLSTFTKLGSRFTQTSPSFVPASQAFAGAAPRKDQPSAPAWMRLAEERPAIGAGALSAEASEQRLEAKRQDLAAVRKFMGKIEGFSELEASLKRNDARVLKEAGRLDVALQRGPRQGESPQAMGLEAMKKEMGTSHQLNLAYLALQEKMQKSVYSIVSNLMKVRSDVVKETINGGGG